MEKKGVSFENGVFMVAAVIGVFFLGFAFEAGPLQNEVGLASQSSAVDFSALHQFSTLDGLGSLPKGNYYIDSLGNVYWLDAGSRVKVAEVRFLEPEESDKYLYIDDNGNVGFSIH